MNSKTVLKNIGISMLMKPVSMVLNLIYTPLVLGYLGDIKYGIWAIILNIISWINYFDVGIGNGLRNKLSEKISLNDHEGANKYVSTAYLSTSFISSIFFIIIVLVWCLFDFSDFFNLQVADENTNAIIAISVCFVCVNFVLSLSKTSAYAIQQPGMISVVGVVGQALQIVTILIVSKLFSPSLLVVAIMYGTISLIESIVLYLIITHHRTYLVPRLKNASKEYFKPLITLGLGFFVLQICSLVLNTTDNLLISNLYGSAAVTPYDIVYKVFYMSVQVHGIIIMPIWSAYTAAAAQKDMGWIKNTMKRLNQVTVLISAGDIIGIFVFKPFARIWLHKDLEYSNTLILIIAIYMIATMIGNSYSSFLCGVGHIKASVIISGIGAVINIPCSIYFSRDCGMGQVGIILGSLVVMMISVFVLPAISHKWISQKSKEWGYEA